MLFSKSISAVAALAMALTSLAAAMPAALEERATSGFTLVEADPNVRVATKDNTINGTSVHNDAVAAPGPSTPFSMTFDNNAQFYNTAPQDIFVVVTATDLNGAAFFLHPNGTVYYPPNPSASQGNVPVTEDIQIKLNPKGQLTNVKLPVYAVGGRVYYSLGQLSFYTNHGSTGTSIVAPSFTSPSDQNINSIYSFLEFSYHSDDAGGYFTNLSYVDIVSLLASQTLLGTDGSSCSVEGAQLNTTRAICSVYQALDQQDGTQLSKSCQIDTKSNQLVRVLSLEHLLELPSQSGDLANYYTDYVNQVYNHYQTNTLTVTEGSNTYTARTDSSGNNLVFNTGDSFAKPNTHDIFTCASGPFANGGSQSRLNITPRLCAAFVRGTLLLDGGNNQPNGVPESKYYSSSAPVFWYGSLVHSFEDSGKGYAFPYDDVIPAGGKDTSGSCQAASTQVIYTIEGY